MPNDYEPFRLVRHPIDFANLGRRLIPHIGRIVRSFDPGARLKGNELWFADPRKSGGDQDRTSASINILTGAWHARSSGAGGGDVISLVAYFHFREEPSRCRAHCGRDRRRRNPHSWSSGDASTAFFQPREL